MRNKALIGVYHSPENLESTIEKINSYNPSSVGLELPQMYLEFEKWGIDDGFFYPLSQEMRNKKVKVFPLENTEYHEKAVQIMMAQKILRGEPEARDFVTEYEMIKELIYNSSPRIEIPVIKFLTERHTNIAKLITSGNLNFRKLFEGCSQNREDYVKQEIEENKPDVVVIGCVHAENLKDNFPEYEFIEIKQL